MMKDFKEIIEQMVKQEAAGILAEHEAEIKEFVRASLLPELRTAVRGSILLALGELLNEMPGDIAARETDENTLVPEDEELESHAPEQGPEIIQESVVPAFRDEGAEQGALGGRYLYCIAESSEKRDFGEIGLNGSRVYTIPCNGLCAVVHDCPAEPYQSLDEEIVKGWVVIHQNVVDKAWEAFGSIIPAAFDTIVQGNGASDPEENMRAWLENDYENLELKMKKVRGNAEFGVQILIDSSTVARRIAEQSPEIMELEEEIKSKPKGLAYMYRQKLEDLLKKQMEKEADRLFNEFYERIKPCVEDIRVEKNKKMDEENKQMLMNLSCLMPRDKDQRLGDELEIIDAMDGFSVRYTGPWPPYSFV